MLQPASILKGFLIHLLRGVNDRGAGGTPEGFEELEEGVAMD